MAFLQFKYLGITAMAGAVPKRIVDNYHYSTHWPEKEIKEVVDKIGIFERRFADENTCSSDLCFAAAEKLFADNNIDREEIDLLIFLSQTPDYRMPGNSFLLQHRLGLSKKCMAFDMSLGCAGFAYALSIAYGIMQGNESIRKAIILNGETRSKVYSQKDRRCAFIFGDAGIAALIERDEKFGKSVFSLNSDGSLADLIMIKGGGYRHMSSSETLKEKVVDEYGNIRSDEQAWMKGADVMSFVVKEVPKDISETLKYYDIEKNNVDYFIFHQANKFINDYMAKKMKLDTNKIPFTIAKYGNTSSVSVPLTIVSELKDKLKEKKTLLLSAFGVGMSWSTAIINVENCKISDIVEV